MWNRSYTFKEKKGYTYMNNSSVITITKDEIIQLIEKVSDIKNFLESKLEYDPTDERQKGINKPHQLSVDNTQILLELINISDEVQLLKRYLVGRDITV